MDVMEACRTRRTVRQFQQKPVPFDLLEKCVDAARLAPSARNLQILEYVVVDSEGPLDGMFKCMGFGGDVESFEGKEPQAYITILINKGIPSNWDKHDSGMAVENIMLTKEGDQIKITGDLVFDRKKYDVSWDSPVKDRVLLNDIVLKVELIGS